MWLEMFNSNSNDLYWSILPIEKIVTASITPDECWTGGYLKGSSLRTLATQLNAVSIHT